MAEFRWKKSGHQAQIDKAHLEEWLLGKITTQECIALLEKGNKSQFKNEEEFIEKVKAIGWKKG